ncbi:Oligopeptide transport system permease protein OppC (TC 3.A.1.5.1) [hydrothermal vent metagenome]|uniref:Oligopeptide transport system permease protein OppC (TC 3.A.1.5.1) n=1 Tax=hydrothermal vent metagenome TaxID=652676 RepID=A0A3B1E171_9ZZZZ
MSNTNKHLSEFELALRQFKKNRMAVVCVTVLGLLYFSAIFADFLSPYSYKNEERSYSYAPVTPIQLFDNGKPVWPFVYGIKLTFNEYNRRIYVTDQKSKYPLKIFSKGDSYKLLGFIPSDRHLITVEAPGRFYFLGADSRGRDLFSRLLYGGRISLSIGLIGVFISFTLGLIIGGTAGYYGGKIDNILMRLCEMFMMVPGFYLLLALRAAVPDDFNSVQVYFAIIVILSLIGWASLARIIRGMCLSLRERDYVLAARSLGLSDFKIITQHILPHTLSYSIFAVMLSIPGYILGESALSLIGLGIQDPFASWGNMLSDSMSIVRIKFAPWILWPAAFIFITVICFNVIGNALRDCLDPMLKGEGVA